MSSTTSGQICHPGKITEERTNNVQDTPEPFHFLKLPGEIRNKIYRLVLVTRNVSKDTPTARHTYRTPCEVTHVVTSAQSRQSAIGTIRCESWRKYTLGYQVSILRANQQIYYEAWSIFHLENFWTVVRVNKAGFGEKLKDLGFPVGTAGDLWHTIRFPIMKVTVIFPSLESQEPSDVMLIASVHLRQLMRAFWTTKGATEMEVTIHVLPPVTNNSPPQSYLLQQFFRLRSIKKVVVLGVSNREHIDKLTHIITTTDGINQTFHELTLSLKSLQRYIKTQQWGYALWQAETHFILLADCMMVYGDRFIGLDPLIDINTALVRCQAASEIHVATTMAIAEVTVQLRQYANTIRFADRALHLISCVSIFERTVHLNPTPAAVTVPHYHQLHPHTGTLATENEAKCLIFLVRARAYMGMQRSELTLEDLEKARELMPDSETLASLSQTWQTMFGPFPCSAALPTIEELD